jgi:hypothetical protein
MKDASKLKNLGQVRSQKTARPSGPGLVDLFFFEGADFLDLE